MNATVPTVIPTEGRLVGAVHADLLASLLNESTFPGYFVAPGCDEYLSIGTGYDVPWPDGRIFVAPVVGGSEGHYVHVLVDGKTVLLGKTFDGWEAAWAFARRLAEVLGVGGGS